MNRNELKKITVVNLFWRFAESVGAQGVSFIVSIILARLLSPDDYGIVALVTVITTILQVFVDSGMGNALVQKKNADNLDFSTVFFFNLGMCFFLYVCVYVTAPYMAIFFGKRELISIIRVISLTLIISGVKNVQQAYVSRNLMFRKFFYSTLGGTLFSAVLGIWCAYRGLGVWSLVFQQLSNAAIDTCILWLTVKWRPKAVFSFDRLKCLFSYGWKLLMSCLIDTVYSNVRQLIIGKVYSSSELAYYNKGKQFPSFIVLNINTSIDSVLLPVLSKEQDDKTGVKTMTRRAIRTSSYIMWPLMTGLAITARPLVLLLLTEKWLPSVTFLRIFCVVFALWPIHTANLNAIKAVGRSDMFLELEIIKKIVGVISIVCTLPFGVTAMAVGYMITGPINAVINAYPNKSLLDYSIKEQCMDIFPFIGMSAVMGLMIWPIQNVCINPLLCVIVQTIVGMIIYAVLSVLFRIDVFKGIVQFLAESLCRRADAET